jgi:chorismate mutase
MSTTLQHAAPPELLSLRAELDRLDDAIHDLIRERAAVVEQVSRLHAKGRTPLRPGREAAILRRLLARHSGAFPPGRLVQVWRDLISGMTAIQGPFVLAVCAPDPASDYVAVAREHFGPQTKLRVHRTPAQAIGAVSAGTATAAILPLPAEEETLAAAWWTALLHKDDPRIHVVARLPFWSPRPEGARPLGALVVSAEPPDPSGEDRSLIGLEVGMEQSRARLAQVLAGAGLDAGTTVLRRDAGSGAARVLVDVAGFVTDGDPRLAALPATLRPPVVLGAYAVPIGGAS